MCIFNLETLTINVCINYFGKVGDVYKNKAKSPKNFDLKSKPLFQTDMTLSARTFKNAKNTSNTIYLARENEKGVFY